jgi:hypothetical protein
MIMFFFSKQSEKLQFYIICLLCFIGQFSEKTLIDLSSLIISMQAQQSAGVHTSSTRNLPKTFKIGVHQ